MLLMEPARIAAVVMLDELEKDTAPSRVVLPRAPDKAIAPLPAAIVKSPLPSIALRKLIFWFAAAVDTVVVPVTTTGLVNVTMPPAVKELDSALEPPPDWVKAPPTFAAEERVKRSLLATIREPPVVVTPPEKVNEAPVKLMPDPPVVVTAPLKVVVPVPALCVMEPAETAPAVTLFALEIVS